LFATREHPKFYVIRMFGLLRNVIQEEARNLHDRGVLKQPEDVWFLELPELLGAVEAGGDWQNAIVERRAEHRRFQTLAPPRVLTSDGEAVIARAQQSEPPPNALVGSPVSGGVVEGPARVVLDPRQAALAKGEILVAPCTDPGWTPLFLTAGGLVMEVGGLMTHGSVVAREYGIPAVVGVPDATRMIRTGQRIRVNGDLGYVELLSTTQDDGGTPV
jgi:pyruvate,water dikinase